MRLRGFSSVLQLDMVQSDTEYTTTSSEILWCDWRRAPGPRGSGSLFIRPESQGHFARRPFVVQLQILRLHLAHYLETQQP
jgi:hypothetical protein